VAGGPGSSEPGPPVAVAANQRSAARLRRGRRSSAAPSPPATGR